MKENKLLIYQVFPRWFGNACTTNKNNGTIEENGVGKFSAFDNKALKEIKKMGFSHVWYTGVLEHATKTDYSAYGIVKDHPDVVKGNAGSPYAIKDYYDVDPDLADNVDKRVEEFIQLIERTHQNDMKVILDFVPNHTARQYKSDAKPKRVKDIGENDNTSLGFGFNNDYYYIPGHRLELQFPCGQGDEAYIEYPAKATGNDRFDNKPALNDWYETVKLNYGIDYCGSHATHFIPVPELWIKLRDILCFWASKGIDAFRCDMAEMVPVEFWNWVITGVKSKYKSVMFIAEIYKPEEYHNYINAGFDYLYDKVGLYDTLRNVICQHQPTSDITFCWQKIDGLQSKMLNFLENHDEQRIASDFFIGDPFKAVPGMIVSATMNTNPVMIYSGQELGEKGMDREGFSGVDGRTTIFDYWSVSSIRDWRNNGKFGSTGLTKEQKDIRKFYMKLLNICNAEAAIKYGKFYDLMYVNYENQFFDSTKQYAFLRSYKNELLFVLVNFSGEAVTVETIIPDDAYTFMGIDSEGVKAVNELFSGKSITLPDGWKNKLKTKVSAYSGIMLKFSL